MQVHTYTETGGCLIALGQASSLTRLGLAVFQLCWQPASPHFSPPLSPSSSVVGSWQVAYGHSQPLHGARDLNSGSRAPTASTLPYWATGPTPIYCFNYKLYPLILPLCRIFFLLNLLLSRYGTVVCSKGLSDQNPFSPAPSPLSTCSWLASLFLCCYSLLNSSSYALNKLCSTLYLFYGWYLKGRDASHGPTEAPFPPHHTELYKTYPGFFFLNKIRPSF